MPTPKFELDVKKMPDLYDRIAFEIAKCFVGKDRRKGVSKSQIRKIFDEAKALGRSLKDSLEDSEKYKFLIIKGLQKHARQDSNLRPTD